MASSSSGNAPGQILKRANATTIQDKFLVGYQGWFTCPGDGEPEGPGHHGWLHWFNHPIPDGGRPNTDVWPDVSSYSPSELFPAPGLKTKAGEPVFLFSSRNAKTVQRHFHWMAEHGVDGVFLQRFARQCDPEAGNEGIMRIRDEVGDRVREAAEREGRVFAIMYDVSGVAPDRIQRILERDWAHLVRNKGVLDSPNYLKEKGKPVVALWGFGFNNAKHTPALVHSIAQFFRNTTPGGVYIMGGTPASWRTADGDADPNPAFLDTWLNDFDAISPWTFRRYNTEQEADGFFENKMKGDYDLIKKRNDEGRGRKVDYIPVVLPGVSGYNPSEGEWGFNNIKRNGGRFLWKQIANAKRLGVRTMYGAMWDEYDEGTAFMPIVEHKGNLPVSEKYRFMALDEDGYDIPSDWYMRICGFAGEGLRSERRIHDTFPVKELQDYWSSRPRYEQVSQKSGDFVSGSSYPMGGGNSSGAGGSGGGGSSTGADGQTYEEWLAAQKEEKEDLPPPPYTLEASEPGPEPTTSPAASNPVQAAPPVIAAAATAAVAGNAPISGMSTAAAVGLSSVAHASPAAMAIGHQPPATGAPQPHNINAGSGPPVVNPSGYAGPSSTTTTTSAYPPPGTNVSGPGPGSFQQQQQQQDPIASLSYGLGRQSISDSGYQPVGGRVGSPIGGTGSPGSSSPIHNLAHAHAHAHTPVGAVEYPGRQSSLSRPGSFSRPNQAPPQTVRPQSQQGYPSQYGQPVSSVGHGHTHTQPLPPRQGSSGSQTQTSQQWPPADWNVTPNQTTSSASSVPPAVPHSTYPTQSGGANLTRPSSFSASSNVAVAGGGGASLRPSSTLSGRPSSAAATSNPIIQPPGSYPSASNSDHRPVSSYSSPQNPSSNSYSASPYPPQNIPSYLPPRPATTVPHTHAQGHASSGYGFPSGPTSSSAYNTGPSVSVSGYPGQGGSLNQGGYPGNPTSTYQPMHGSSYTWSSGPSSHGHGSPPHSPPGVIGGASFPNPTQSTYPNSPTRPYNPAGQGLPVQQQYSFPSSNLNHGGSTPPMSAYQTSSQDYQASSQDMPFPHALSGPPPGTDGNYFGSSNMPTSNASSAYSYPGQYGHGSSSPPPSFPGQGGPVYDYPQPAMNTAPAPGPWVPPARPPTHSGTSSSSYGKPSTGPIFPSASGGASSTALGFALSAVDKVAGKKTREQLEREVENLAQTGTKLFNKYINK